METRVFGQSMTVLSTDGQHREKFNPGERAKNIKRFGTRVMFEPADAHRVAGTYVMEWSEFEATTTRVTEARA